MAFDWIKNKAKEAKEEIESKVADKLMEEDLDPTLRDSKDQPLKAVERKREGNAKPDA